MELLYFMLKCLSFIKRQFLYGTLTEAFKAIDEHISII